MASLKVRGFVIPEDTAIIVRTLFLCARYVILIKVRSIEAILDGIEKAGPGDDFAVITEEEHLTRMTKIRKAADFFLRRLMGYRTPCLPRSLVLYRWCVEKQIAAEIAIGVRKEYGTLKGHAWISLRGRPFLEDENDISGYRVMLSRSNHEGGRP